MLKFNVHKLGKAMTKHIKQSNTRNQRFYEKLSIDTLSNLAITGGLDTGSDLILIQKLIEQASSILEVGAGYGRVLKHLQDVCYKGKLTAIEQSHNFFQHLRSMHDTFAQLHHGDIVDFKTDTKFDLILWLWSGIADFGKEEQPLILKKLRSFLHDTGTLVVDTMPIEIQPLNSIVQHGQDHAIESTNIPTHHGYFPSHNEILDHAMKYGFKEVTKKDYITTTGRNRILYLLQS